MRKLVHALIGYRKVQKTIDLDPEMSASKFVTEVNSLFDVQYQVHGVESNYKSTIFFCTHHTGALDFLAVYDALSESAPNLKVILNNKLNVIKPLRSISIEVNSVSSGKPNTEAKKQIDIHLKNGGNILVFPAGRVASRTNGIIEDSEWRLGIFKILMDRAENAVGIYCSAENPPYFYKVRKYFPKLSMLFLMRCLADHKNECIDLFFTPKIGREAFKNSPKELSEFIRHKVYQECGGKYGS